jgi:hypothetical protein
LDIQQEAARSAAQLNGKAAKGKQKALPEDEAESEVAEDHDDESMDEETEPMPMVPSESITTLRAKLHDRIAAMRKARRPDDEEAGSKDELLEERRRKRAALRENRRKRTKERIRKEDADKQKAHGTKEKGNQPKVAFFQLRDRLAIKDHTVGPVIRTGFILKECLFPFRQCDFKRCVHKRFLLRPRWFFLFQTTQSRLYVQSTNSLGPTPISR